MNGHRKYNARMQVDFYRDRFRQFVKWLLLELMIISLCLCVVVYLLIIQPSRTYYANTTDGKMLSMMSEMRQGN